MRRMRRMRWRYGFEDRIVARFWGDEGTHVAGILGGGDFISQKERLVTVGVKPD
jgi:hypothetical protein